MKKWAVDEDGFLDKSIGFLTYEQIAKELNRTRRSIMGHCRWRGLSNSVMREKTQFKKKYRVEDNFFSDYNLLSCYYAGLIASDGCVHKKNNTISIAQSENRLSCLEKFKKDVGYNGVIYGPTKTIGQDVYTLVISSSQWKKDLKDNFNIMPNKSLTLFPPNLKDEKMVISFITGLIDGDGSIGVYKYKNKKDIVPIITFCGTKKMVQWVSNFLNKYFFLKSKNINYRQITSDNTYFLSFSGRKVIKYYNYITFNNIPFMFCKWEKFITKTSEKGLDYYLEDKRKLMDRNKNGRFCKIG